MWFDVMYYGKVLSEINLIIKPRLQYQTSLGENFIQSA